MPNVWTHILFSQDVAKELNLQFSNTTHQNYLHLGAQGPDPFFYHNFWPWQKDDRINQLGSKMHKEKCGTVLLHMIQSAKNKNETTQIYMLGFITHHVLDRVTHPYIHYKSGYSDYNHQKLETIIDTIMMEKFRSFKIWKSPVTTQINVDEIDSELAQIMESILKTHFGNEIELESGFFEKSYLDMKKALRIVYDPLGWKTKVLAKLMPPISHRPIHDNIDYLNEERNTWYHSATNEPQQDSFLDLYNQALREAIPLIQEIINYWEDRNDDIKTVEKLLGDISYDTGKPLSERLENKYAEPIV